LPRVPILSIRRCVSSPLPQISKKEECGGN